MKRFLVSLVALLVVAQAPAVHAAQAVNPATGGPVADEYGQFAQEEGPSDVADPLEGFNRAMFEVNDKLYFYLFKPTAIVYKAAVIEPVRVGISNAFDNIKFPIRFLNCLLQGKLTRAGQEVGRFALNSTFGLGGLFKVSDGVDGLNPEDDEDTGQTLGTYGMGHGFYLVLPLMGPSSARDTVGSVADSLMNPVTWIFGPPFTNNAGFVHDEHREDWLPYVINAEERVNYLSLHIGDYEKFKEESLDPYVALRDAYIQNRDGAVKQ